MKNTLISLRKSSVEASWTCSALPTPPPHTQCCARRLRVTSERFPMLEVSQTNLKGQMTRAQRDFRSYTLQDKCNTSFKPFPGFCNITEIQLPNYCSGVSIAQQSCETCCRRLSEPHRLTRQYKELSVDGR